jgi:hypothetical protein
MNPARSSGLDQLDYHLLEQMSSDANPPGQLGAENVDFNGASKFSLQ